MFEGAPCFSVVEGTKDHRPQVVIHGGSAGDATYLPDHKPLEHDTFSACTLGVQRVQESEDIPFTSYLRIDSKNTGAGDSIVEVPSMLSANGVERGTVGFENFLQLPIADSLTPPDEAATFERRHLLVSDPAELGLRTYDLAQLVDRLTDASNLYKGLNDGTIQAEKHVPQLGESLFSTLLSTDFVSTPGEAGQIYPLETQIDALQKLLDTKGLWHNFSLVEWRIRIGQLLWTSNDSGVSEGHLSERDVFILQVTLAAELLVRLKTLDAEGRTDVSSTKLERSTKVKWDLLLAERFMNNLSVSTLSMPNGVKTGMRNSFFSAISFFTSGDDIKELATKPLLQPKNEDKQIAGLMAFAKALEWPHTDDVHAQLRPPPDAAGNERPVSMVSIYATPLNSPSLFTTENTPGTRSSYFGAMGKQQQRPGMSRMETTQSIQLRPASEQPDGFNVGGWLSRSWLSGLILPGEPSSHFLISTLLENSPQAIETLGDSADLYGGFVYDGRTFWSKSSAVGRVMAAGSGASECMGWISSPGAPAEHPGGWVDVEVSDFPYPSTEPRIKAHGAVAKHSDPFHNNPSSQLRAGDFTLPTDSPPVMGNEVLSLGLSFSSPDDASDSSDAAKSKAHLTFVSPINSKMPRISVPLTYDVHFISSYPCYPVSTDSAKNLSSSSDPNNLTLHTTYTIDTPPPPAHPLHSAYRFMTLPVATLLSFAADETRSRALSLPDQKAEDDNADEEEEVAVLDCRGKSDLELLARAWCAKVGENAVVGKVGRTCLACCIREARGLGVRVVIRI